MDEKYEQLEHTADIAIRVYGRELEDLFVNSSFALFDMLVDTTGLSVSGRIEIRLSSGDMDTLFVDWLNELLYIFQVEGKVVLEAVIEGLDKNSLRASCLVAETGTSALLVRTEIKAATYHGLHIIRKRGRYELEVVFDV